MREFVSEKGELLGPKDVGPGRWWLLAFASINLPVLDEGYTWSVILTGMANVSNARFRFTKLVNGVSVQIGPDYGRGTGGKWDHQVAVDLLRKVQPGIYSYSLEARCPNNTVVHNARLIVTAHAEPASIGEGETRKKASRRRVATTKRPR